MRETVYIVCDIDGPVRMTKRYPSLGRDEIGVAIKLTIPDTAFRSPVVTASLTVPEEKLAHPEIEIEAIMPERPE